MRYDRSMQGAALSSGGFGDPFPKVGSVYAKVCVCPCEGALNRAWQPVAAMRRSNALAGGGANPNLGGFGRKRGKIFSSTTGSLL